MVDLLKRVSSNLPLLLKVDEIKKPALHSAGFFVSSTFNKRSRFDDTHY